MRGDVVRRAPERLSAAKEHWILAAVAVVSEMAAYWYMRSRMRRAGPPCVLPYPGSR